MAPRAIDHQMVVMLAIYRLVIYQLPLIWSLANFAIWSKAGAKVLLFFELTKYFCIFFAKDSIFLANMAYF